MATTEDLKLALSRNLKRLRTARGWSLDELATRSGISRAMIVQVEGGRTNASLGTMCELADALAVPVQSLIELAEEKRVQVMPAAETSLLWSDAKGSFARLLCGTATREKLEFWSWRLEPLAEYTSKAHPHGTRELIWIMSGALCLATGGHETTANAGDSIIFEADQEHTYRCAGTEPCEFTMIVQLGVA